MLLPDFILPSRVNQVWDRSGIDSYPSCLDKKHYSNYPHPVIYQYNSRGFRDQEWPDNINELQQSIWCVGDSFTVGLGSPATHTWSYLLEQKTNRRTINISMDGASNSWIARKAVGIFKEIKPVTIVIHWSYIDRRELDDPTLNDEDRRLQYLDLDNSFNNLQQCVESLEQNKRDSQVIHSFIPNSYFATENNADQLTDMFKGACNLGIIPQLDYSRDRHHYDIKTSDYFTDLIVAQLAR